MSNCLEDSRDFIVRGTLQARILEFLAVPFSRGSFKPGIKPRSPALQEDYFQAALLEKPIIHNQFSSVLLLSRVLLFATPRIAACQDSLFIINSRSSPKLMSIELVMPSSHLILCRPLLLLSPIPASIRVFSNESTLHMSGPKYWSFSLSISPSNEYSGLISFRMDQLDLLAVKGTLKSLLQYHSSKAPIIWDSAFFIVQH